jgi:hypothetical protein
MPNQRGPADSHSSPLQSLLVTLLRRRGPGRKRLPIIHLAVDGPPPRPLLAAIGRLLRRPRPSAAHVLVAADTDDDVRSILARAARWLGGNAFGVPLPRYDLVDWLTGQPEELSRNEVALRLAERPGPLPGLLGAGLAVIGEIPKLGPVLTAMVRPLAPAASLWLGWGLRSRGRWIARQHHTVHGNAKGFRGVAAGLTGINETGEAGAVDRLLVSAFLEDLRTGYRRLPARIRQWPRTANTVLILDGSGGQGFLRVLGELRRLPGARRRPDPLLVVAGVSTTMAGQVDVADAVAAYEEWAAGDGPDLLLTVTSADTVSQFDGSPRETFGPPPPAIYDRPVPLAMAGVAVAIAVALLSWASLAGHGPSERPAAVHEVDGCRPDRTAEVWRRDGECLGSRTDGTPFGPAGKPDDQAAVLVGRLLADQRAVFAQNRCAQQLVLNNPARPALKLVYLAGLTSDATWSAAQAEELEGLLLQQIRHNGSLLPARPSLPAGGCGPPPEGQLAPLIVVVANGGNKMENAFEVGNRLLPMFARDKTILGVTGLDRSVPATKRLIGLFDGAGIPVVPTTLSADRLWEGTKHYYQMVPSNHAEADLIAPALVGKADAARRARLTVVVAYPSDADASGDIYVTSLRNDVLGALQKRQVRPQSLGWAPDADGGFPAAVDEQRAALCPPGKRHVDALVYVGRHEAFEGFLRAVATDPCDGGALTGVRIIADDAITRYVASRSSNPFQIRLPTTVSFVTKAPGLVAAGPTCVAGNPKPRPNQVLDNFCGYLNQLYQYLGRGLPSDRRPLTYVRWPGERVGAAYDAAEFLYLAATWTGAAPSRQSAVDHLPDVGEHGFQGAVGRYTFNDSRLSNGQLGIARVDDLATPDQKTCIALTSRPTPGVQGCGP